MANNDITIRAEAYLKSMAVQHHREEEENESFFCLPPNRREIGMLEEQALHLWVTRQTKGALSMPYSRLKAICQQIKQYPERTQWKMNIGYGWDITRNGEILFLSKNGETIHGNSEEKNYNDNNHWKIHKKEIDEYNGDDNSEVHFVTITLSNDLLKAVETGYHDFVVKTVADNELLTFLPPWRSSTSKPKRIKEFLRGQKIPLHRRNEIPLLCLHNDNSNHDDHIVAVYLDNKEEGTWVVNTKFDKSSVDGNKYTIILVKC